MCISQKELYNPARTILRINSFLGVSMSLAYLGVDNINTLPAVTSADADDQAKYDLEKYEEYARVIQATYTDSNRSEGMSIAQYANMIAKYDLPDEVANVCYNR